MIKEFESSGYFLKNAGGSSKSSTNDDLIIYFECFNGRLNKWNLQRIVKFFVSYLEPRETYLKNTFDTFFEKLEIGKFSLELFVRDWDDW